MEWTNKSNISNFWPYISQSTGSEITIANCTKMSLKLLPRYYQKRNAPETDKLHAILLMLQVIIIIVVYTKISHMHCSMKHWFFEKLFLVHQKRYSARIMAPFFSEVTHHTTQAKVRQKEIHFALGWFWITTLESESNMTSWYCAN